ncbi:hypothetical protein [Streptantibioticus rubrisoli]|uniref:DUF2637 domain-containing protein n=1 Tax=Streptantibioticus rubrisoli TaxID=1387313 RepID=A0ABT1PMW3_9ACTN|nr:hypothetical protein [Streptantibioticus rubrisoli]MCQ4046700.1 hypothetical protein [Streptantibioticus rubrisoli]
MSTVDPRAIRRTNAVLSAGTWFIITGVVFYSLMTTTPFVAAHSARGWEWSGFVLGLMVDAAFVMALQADSLLSGYGVADPGPWPRRFRFFTGGASVFLNTWHAVEGRDWVGVAVHLIAPALLLIVAEVGPVYRRAMADALARAEASTEQATPSAPVSTPVPVPVAEQVPSQVTEEDTPAVHVDAEPAEEPAEVDAEEPARLSTEEARKVIEYGWTHGLSVRETAEAATRSVSYVGSRYKRLDDERGPRPVAGQLSLIKG